jgi:hypothetical protein
MLFLVLLGRQSGGGLNHCSSKGDLPASAMRETERDRAEGQYASRRN